MAVMRVTYGPAVDGTDLTRAERIRCAVHCMRVSQQRRSGRGVERLVRAMRSASARRARSFDIGRTVQVGDPCSQRCLWTSRAPRLVRATATWAADRFTRIGAEVLDHRKFRDAMHAVDTVVLHDISARLAGVERRAG